ncbi:MAG: transcriptional regulator, LacI family [Chthonomonadales bacterium]|nr:transcriptional regulator, LacI family [Chthonomonadales bacterium]
MPVRGSTIRDVALLAGVAVGTASKAFNRKGTLSTETRKRVLEAAASLHYVPNALIRSLQQRRTYTIGVLTWKIRASAARDITLDLLKGISEGVTEGECDTLLYSRRPERMANITAATFLDGRIDGLIMGTNELDQSQLQALVESTLPVVVLYQRDVPQGLGWVDVDNRTGIASAVDHLIALGHRRIAFYAPFFTFNYSEREHGYRQALQRHGISPDPALCFIGTRQAPHAGEACKVLLTLPDPPTALIAGDDAAAFECIAALEERGAHVPEAISVIGFDDVADAATSPGLTTIHHPAEQVGYTAARFVEQIIQGAAPEDCRSIQPVQLVVRNSTAPPRLRTRT